MWAGGIKGTEKEDGTSLRNERSAKQQRSYVSHGTKVESDPFNSSALKTIEQQQQATPAPGDDSGAECVRLGERHKAQG
ncbi:hypothetical protein Pcinc_016881 [Petrolisthes cinctipes]|uniref:Uncharacterized protein n=1 Tax=Petrolisthes cinctipes TaxID=88211 RepID=A0AAE1FRW8_PETCI|nr:hypothetical protein Pcinc_016881 [Petrolisthes cinctipes]